MNILRKSIDKGYPLVKELIYRMTEGDPEVAHNRFIQISKLLNLTGLDGILFDNDSNKKELPFELSNAAGFNKNGEIPPQFLEYLGFNRIVVGTVTGEEWQGNPIPRMVRYPETKSIVNWMGLPGVGAKRVGEILESFGKISIPITINLMGTPGKTGDELLYDLETTIKYTFSYTDRFELNISCPNTHLTDSCKMDARSEYQKQLAGMLSVLNKTHKEIYLKVSPDLDLDGVKEILDVVVGYNVAGITATNTTTNHLPQFILNSPGKGGASGKAVKPSSKIVQDYFIDEINKRDLDLKLIACGGIDSIYEVKAMLEKGASGIQVYTPLIFEGPKLITDIRSS
jgi:dihydroorotate dehydrogenase